MDSITATLVQLAIQEDLGDGDVTSAFFIAENARCKARIIAREAGIMSGMPVVEAVFRAVDPGIGIWVHCTDGRDFARGETLVELEGRTRSILSAERTALNFLQRLCGIATLVRTYVEAIKPHSAVLLDTRKTTPGWRALEKAAVAHGGGVNHRMGLYDQVMVKDNHLLASGKLEDLQAAIDRVNQTHPGMKIQIEAAALDQVADFLSLRGVDMILLDNMNIEQLRKAVEITAGRVWLEASGGITLANVHEVAATGVNAISVGALTHSARALDLALDLY